MIYPIPQSVQQTGSYPVKAYTLQSADALVQNFCARYGIPCGENGNILVSCKQDNSSRFSYIEQARRVTEEAYLLQSEQQGERLAVTITAAGERGMFHALQTLQQQLQEGEVLLGEILDYPLFEKRGYLEGFYGKPWTPAQRLSVLELMAQNKMNSYYYAPKDDPYHRDLWNELYPAQELADLKGLVSASNGQFVDFHYNIAPGLSMRYSSEEDYQALYNKLMQIYEIGVRKFGLLLDDIPKQLQYPEDIARFGSETVHAHIYLGNRLFDDLMAKDRGIEMTLCPLQYHGKGDEYFISKLGQGLDPRIHLFWTGYNICSQDLTVPEAITFIRSTTHKPLYWDNFPVNDAEMYNEMHLGYIHGRDAELYRYSDGIISNCMEYCECSKIPLLTVADFLWNPHAYNPMESWYHAQGVVIGEGVEDFRILSDHLLTSCLKVENSPYMNRTFAGAESALRIGNPFDALKVLGEYTEQVGRCCDLVLGEDRPIFKELRGWAEKLKAAHETLQAGLELLGSTNPENAKILKQKLHDYMRLPEVLTEFSLQVAVEELLKLAENNE